MSAQLLCPLTDGLCLGGGDGLPAHAVHALPEAVGLAHAGLPQTQGAVLAATRIQLTVWEERRHDTQEMS